MVDRLDIDALLIGSLYGELNAADEVRLQAHLESHPGDRAILTSLTRARELLHQSRYLQIQLEPPQAISALLLQQAAHHAPKVKAVAVEAEREGWFARFVRSFVGHPAMAAAAMLVLVLGVAGVLYMRKGDHFAQPEASRPPTATDQTQEQRPQLAQEKGERDKAKDSTSDSYKAELAPDPAPAQAEGKKFGGGNATASPERMVPPPQRVLEAKTAPGPTPKELDDERGADKVVKADVAVKPAEAPAMTPPSAPAPRSQAEGAAARPTTDGDTFALEKDSTHNRGMPGNAQGPRTTPPPPPPTAGSGSAATVARTENEQQQGETLAWAKQQHQKLVTETQRNQCETAAATAVALSLRAPGYYQQNVESDRTLKQCIVYINRAREAEAEMRARQTRKRPLEEPAPAAPSKAAAPADKR